MGFKTWEEAADAAAEKIFHYEGPYISGLGNIDVELHKSVDVINWVAVGSAAASVTDDVYRDAIVATVVSKQHDYGHENIARHGLVGIHVRMCDKVERIKNLARRDEPANEPLADSYADLVGYSIIAVMWQDGTFMLPLERDMRPNYEKRERFGSNGAWSKWAPWEPTYGWDDPRTQSIVEMLEDGYLITLEDLVWGSKAQYFSHV